MDYIFKKRFYIKTRILKIEVTVFKSLRYESQYAADKLCMYQCKEK